MNPDPSTTCPDPSPSSRRSRSRLAAWGIAGVLIMTTALSACGHRQHHGGEGISEERVTKMVDKVFSRVDATDDQKRQISTIANQAVSQLKPMRESMRQARAQALTLLSAQAIDRAAIEVLRAEQMQTANTASTIMSNALADIAEVLTPEQRLQVHDKLSERMKRHGAAQRSE